MTTMKNLLGAFSAAAVVTLAYPAVGQVTTPGVTAGNATIVGPNALVNGPINITASTNSINLDSATGIYTRANNTNPYTNGNITLTPVTGIQNQATLVTSGGVTISGPTQVFGQTYTTNIQSANGIETVANSILSVNVSSDTITALTGVAPANVAVIQLGAGTTTVGLTVDASGFQVVSQSATGINAYTNLTDAYTSGKILQGVKVVTTPANALNGPMNIGDISITSSNVTAGGLVINSGVNNQYIQAADGQGSISTSVRPIDQNYVVNNGFDPN